MECKDIAMQGSFIFFPNIYKIEERYVHIIFLWFKLFILCHSSDDMPNEPFSVPPPPPPLPLIPHGRLASTPAMFNSTLTENEEFSCPVDGSIMITGECMNLLSSMNWDVNSIIILSLDV